MDLRCAIIFNLLVASKSCIQRNLSPRRLQGLFEAAGSVKLKLEAEIGRAKEGSDKRATVFLTRST